VINLIKRCGQDHDHFSLLTVPSHPTPEILHQQQTSKFQGPAIFEDRPDKGSAAIEITTATNLVAVLGFNSPDSSGAGDGGSDDNGISKSMTCRPQADIRTDSAASFETQAVEESQIIDCVFGNRRGFLEV
jgi:hypothetical protein